MYTISISIKYIYIIKIHYIHNLLTEFINKNVLILIE